MAFRMGRSLQFAVAGLIAAVISAAVYIGMLALGNAEHHDDFVLVEGAVRLSQPQQDDPVEPVERKKLRETEPPKKLPKTFTTKTKTTNVKPQTTISTPQFSATPHPALKGGVSVPDVELGGIGFSMDEVDQIPQVVRSVPPEYPFGAKRKRLEGEVVVRMLVTRDGSPSSLSIHSSTPKGVFDEAALNAARRWKFRPGQYRGQDVDTWVLLPFNFELTR